VIDFDALEKINQQALVVQLNPDVDSAVKKIQIFDESASHIVDHENNLESCLDAKKEIVTSASSLSSSVKGFLGEYLD